MITIEKVLERLAALKVDTDYYARFNLPAASAKILRFEKMTGVRLPLSHKKFLKSHNGGMIVFTSLTENDKHKAEYVCLLSIEEIVERYSDLKSRSWKVNMGMTDLYPIIPFCSMPNNEVLVFIYGQKSGEESPVFDAFHESSPSEWGIVAPDFTSFLSTYLDTHGHPEVLGDEEAGVASDYIDEIAVTRETEKETVKETVKETTDETLTRTEAELRIDPDSPFTCYERALALKEKGDIEQAYLYISRAIEIDGQDAFYRYIRGAILSDAGEHRAALIDYDVSVKLKPDDTFYLYSRADSFFHLAMLHASLNDCNKIIEMEDNNLLAYMLRRDLYEALNMEDKASDDQQVIDRLRQG
jgi:tetratricopeptide (TPR) repeat protein